jgi:para-nitrobenzyl esterase
MSATDHPEVHVSGGTVRGRREDGLVVFRGIPFAQPPVGEHRFAAPQPALPWDGVREAAAFGPPPQQSSAFGPDPRGERSVDPEWLTVNVWSPAGGAALPVMVWIYGGAYLAGESGDPAYNGTLMAAQGVVVVTLNYRVGMEGFAQIEGAPANRGLLDQIAALEWVRDNIAAFGGDPDRVTVFGESAGAGSIAALLVMPRAAGLFRRAITQSVPGPFFSKELADDIGVAFASELGLRPTVADLSSVDPAALAAAGDAVTAKLAQYEDRWGAVAHCVTPFSPVVDGDVLPQDPWQALAAGAARDIDLIVGHNQNEYRLFIAMAGRLGQITDEQANTVLRGLAPGPEAEAAYQARGHGAGDLYERISSDWLFDMPSLHLAEAHTSGGGHSYLYQLTWSAPGMGGAFGACHGLDIPLTLGNLSAGLGALLIGEQPPADAVAVSEWIRAAWSAFAVTSDPGWPVYDTEQRLTQLIDVEPGVAPYPAETTRLIWADHTFSALPLRLA